MVQADSSGIELYMLDCVYETNKANKILHFENEKLTIQAFAIARIKGKYTSFRFSNNVSKKESYEETLSVF